MKVRGGLLARSFRVFNADCVNGYDGAPAYTPSWLRAVGSDPPAVTAASKSQAAADYLIGFAQQAPANDELQPTARLLQFEGVTA